MNSGKTKKSRGMAIIITLFTVLIVLTLGVSFLMISFRESKVTRGEKEGIMALQTANAGIELMLNYMSDIENWDDDDSFDYCLVTGEVDFKSDIIEDENEALTFSIDLTKINDDADSAFETYLYDVTINPRRRLATDPSSNSVLYYGGITLQVRQTYLMENQVPNFIITSTGAVFRPGDDSPIAQRTVEARIREACATDVMLFVQNMRAWDVLGGSPPNAEHKTNDAVGIANGTTFYGDMVVDGHSDFATETAGSLHFLDNDNNSGNGTVNDNVFKGSVSVTEDDEDSNGDGNYNVYPDGVSDNDKEDMFSQGMMTNQASMGLPDSEKYLSIDKDGDGTISSTEEGKVVALAKDESLDGKTNPAGRSYVQSYFRCGDNDGISGVSAGDIGHSMATDPTQWEDKWGFGAGKAVTEGKMDKDVPADIEFDGLMLNSKPGFAKFLVTFNENGTVTVKKQTKYTKQTVTLLNNVNVDQFKNGVLVFEGGNVEVSGTCKGKLTVVATEDPTREPYAYDITTSDGVTTEQSAYRSVNQEKWNNGEIDSDYVIPGKVYNKKVESFKPKFSDSSIYVGWDESWLPQRMGDDGELGDDFDRVPPYFHGGKWVWPADSSCNNTIAVVKDKTGAVVESVFSDWTAPREGNAIIGGDLQYASENAADTVLGIVAKNYILLNDSSVSDQWEDQLTNGTSDIKLNVQAVLMSFDHSLQFDDINLANKPDSFVCAEGMNGTFNFKGSYISPYADIEGKMDANNQATIGYTNQQFRYDSNLLNIQPPSFPRWDPSSMAKTWRTRSAADSAYKKPLLVFVVLSYQDKASIALK